MPGMFKSNFDYQLVRGMLADAYGEGRAFGELYSTARRVVDRVLAEAILRKLGAGRFNAYSAGSHPKRVVNPFALKELESLGLLDRRVALEELGRILRPKCARIGFRLYYL
jgi:arsenate reductase (thioredoxin)